MKLFKKTEDTEEEEPLYDREEAMEYCLSLRTIHRLAGKAGYRAIIEFEKKREKYNLKC